MNVLINFCQYAPHILVNLQTFKLGIATTHWTLPRSSITVHLQIGLQIKTLGPEEDIWTQLTKTAWPRELMTLPKTQNTCTCIRLQALTTDGMFNCNIDIRSGVVLTWIWRHSAPLAGSLIFLNVTGHFSETFMPVCWTLSSELLKNHFLTVNGNNHLGLK